MARDTDRAWSVGVTEIEHEAQLDALPEDQYLCFECGLWLWRDEDPPTVCDAWHDDADDVDLPVGWIAVEVCPDCMAGAEAPR